MNRSLRRLVLLAAVAVMATGCALANPEKRPMTRFVSRAFIPSSTQGRILASPIILVLGAVAITSDAFVFHPLMEVDDAWRDTAQLCWGSFGEPGRYVSDCASIPLRLVGTPLIFVADWLARCFEDAPAHRPKSEKKSPEEEEEPIAVFPFNFWEFK